MREAIIRAVLSSVPSNGALIGIFKQTMSFNVLLGLSVCLEVRLSFLSKVGATHRC